MSAKRVEHYYHLAVHIKGNECPANLRKLIDAVGLRHPTEVRARGALQVIAAAGVDGIAQIDLSSVRVRGLTSLVPSNDDEKGLA